MSSKHCRTWQLLEKLCICFRSHHLHVELQGGPFHYCACSEEVLWSGLLYQFLWIYYASWVHLNSTGEVNTSNSFCNTATQGTRVFSMDAQISQHLTLETARGEVTVQANRPHIQSVGVQDFQKPNLILWGSWKYVVNFSKTSGIKLTQQPLGTGGRYPPLPATADKDVCLTKVLREMEATPDKTSFKRL